MQEGIEMVECKFEKLLTIVLPTRNHTELVRFFIEKTDYLEKYNIYLQVHDSSTNDETQELVMSINSNHISYQRYDSDTDIDVKTILALQGVETKYAFLCGDGVIFNANAVYENIYTYLKKDVDVIEMYDDNLNKHIDYYNHLKERKKSDPVIYNNITEHFVDNCWHMPLYGGSIVKSVVFRKFDFKLNEDLIGKGFVYPFSIYDYFSAHEFYGCVCGGSTLIPNPLKKDSIWMKKGWGIEIWAHKYPYSINRLPDLYNDYKLQVIKETGVRTTFLTKNGLAYWKTIGSYSLELYKEYKDDLIQYTYLDNGFLFILAIMPRGCMKLIRKVKHLFQHRSD